MIEEADDVAEVGAHRVRRPVPLQRQVPLEAVGGSGQRAAAARRAGRPGPTARGAHGRSARARCARRPRAGSSARRSAADTSGSGRRSYLNSPRSSRGRSAAHRRADRSRQACRLIRYPPSSASTRPLQLAARAGSASRRAGSDSRPTASSSTRDRRRRRQAVEHETRDVVEASSSAPAIGRVCSAMAARGQRAVSAHRSAEPTSRRATSLRRDGDQVGRSWSRASSCVAAGRHARGRPDRAPPSAGGPSRDAVRRRCSRAPERAAASTITVPVDSAAISRLRVRKRCRCGAAPGGLSETSSPLPAARSNSVVVRRRVRAIEPAGRHQDRQPADRQRAAVRGGVDAVRAAGHDLEPTRGQPAGEVGGDLLTVGRGGPRADDARPTGRRASPAACRAPHPQSQRRNRLAGAAMLSRTGAVRGQPRRSAPASRQANAKCGHSSDSGTTSRMPCRSAAARSASGSLLGAPGRGGGEQLRRRPRRARIARIAAIGPSRQTASHSGRQAGSATRLR